MFVFSGTLSPSPPHIRACSSLSLSKHAAVLCCQRFQPGALLSSGNRACSQRGATSLPLPALLLRHRFQALQGKPFSNVLGVSSAAPCAGSSGGRSPCLFVGGVAVTGAGTAYSQAPTLRPTPSACPQMTDRDICFRTCSDLGWESFPNIKVLWKCLGFLRRVC